MKASKATIARAVDQPVARVRFYLFHGPDESQSRALAARLLDALGATKSALAANAIRSNPALLVDEASALSLFGGRQLIWIEPATKDIEEAVAVLLAAAETETPVVAIAAALSRSSGLLKMAETSPLAVAFAAYAPEGRDAERMVIDLARCVGLKTSATVAARIADGAENDQAIVAQELQKLALFLDASTVAPKELDHAAIDAVGAEGSGGNALRLGDHALEGDVNEMIAELDRLMPANVIPAVRSLQRRLLMLAPARARVERGEPIDAVMTSLGKSLFWNEKNKVQRILSKWGSGDLAVVADRVGRLERSLMFSPAPDRESLGEELIAIARKARSL